MFVVKRSGELQELNIIKIKNVVRWATEGLNVNPLELESNLQTVFRDRIPTKEINKNMVFSALRLADKEAPDWLKVAGRLKYRDLKDKTERNRDYDLGNFLSHIKYHEGEHLYDGELSNRYTNDEIEEIGEYMVTYRDLLYDYTGITQLEKRYLMRTELPQELFLVLAMYVCMNEKEDRLGKVKQVYDLISLKKLSLATPILSNLRKPNANLASCFIMGLNDDLDSIFQGVHDSARISKNGGGVGVNFSHIRARGAEINKNKNASNGVVPLIKVFNDTAVAINQNGKRAGAITVSLDVWHLDIEEFLEMQTEKGDPRLKAFDVFPQVVVPDLFMEKVKKEENWYLLDPYSVKKELGYDLPKLWGKKFEEAYGHISNLIHTSELAFYEGQKVKFLYKEVKAKELFKEVIKSQIETGLPYIFFKDTANLFNPNQKTGYIPSANLCVAPETRILTDRGHYPIAELENQEVTIWNGEEWSQVTVKKTGTNQPLMKVNLSNGESIECTYYHKFWVQDSYRSKPRKVEAKDLTEGMKLIKYELPLIADTENSKDFPYAYTSGAYTGDGTVTHNYPMIHLYGDKKDLLDQIEVRNKYWGNKNKTVEKLEKAVNYYEEKITCRLPLDIPPKFTVPAGDYTIKSKLEWLAGLLDTDGTVCRNGSNESLSISSINKTFLLEVRLMLQTLGVDTKVVLMCPEQEKEMPNGKGGTKTYKCKQSYRLLISSNGLNRLAELGLTTHRLKWEQRLPQREASRFIEVISLEHEGRVDDTYCVHEPERNMVMFNGVLTGNCVESFSNVEPDKYTHVCNLVSINLSDLSSTEEEQVCKWAVRILDNLIDIGKAPTAQAELHNSNYRVIGVGFMGLADWLAVRAMNYSTGSREIFNLFDRLSYYCVEQSRELAVERGAYFEFSKSEWAEGKILGRPLEWFLSNSDQGHKWADLSEKIKQTGIRNGQIMAIAPNTSTSLIQGCTASILPPYKLFSVDFNSKGSTMVAVPYLEQKRWYYKENKYTNQQELVEVIGKNIAPFIDSGISMELVFNGANPEINSKFIADTIFKAWESGNKTIYYVRLTDDQPEDFCCACAN